MPVSFGTDAVAFTRYMVPLGARARPFTIHASEILEVRSGRAPPEILLPSGEVIFIEAIHKEALIAFAAQHGIPDCRRPDIWEMLTEPFLDTTFSPEVEAQTLETLAAHGIPPAEAMAIRARIGPLLLRYNAIHWEWVALLHVDVLWAFGLRNRAYNAILFFRRKALYDWCNAIARRGRE